MSAPPTTPAAHSDSRLPALDGLRGVAILLVLQFHFWGAGFSIIGVQQRSGLDEALLKIAGVGWVGVDLFFVLSGFLITGILVDARKSGNYFRSFYARRFLRILPLYYGFLLFAVVVLPTIERFDGAGATPRLGDAQFWSWSFLSNVAGSVKQIDVHLPVSYIHLWSLSVEEQFYLAWPLLVLLTPRHRLAHVCLALAAGAFLLRLGIATGLMDSLLFRSPAAYTLMPARADGLALGGLVAIALREGHARAVSSAAVPAALASCCALALLFAVRKGISPGDAYVATIGFSATAVLFASVVAMTVVPGRSSVLPNILEHPVLRWVGRYSYAMYLFHLLITWKVAQYGARVDLVRYVHGSQLPSNIAFSLIATLVTFGAAYASWHLYEKHFLKLKGAFAYRPAPPRAERPATAGALPSPAGGTGNG